MGFNVTYKGSVAKDLQRLDKSEARRLLNKIEKELPDRASDCPGLKGAFAGLRKFRIGDFRVIFTILGDNVLVLRIGNRKDVYKHR